jgi:hypothetical protein
MSAGFIVEKRTIRLEWKPQDCWIGVFWKRRSVRGGIGPFDLWVCLLPMLPIHYRHQRTWVCSTEDGAG